MNLAKLHLKLRIPCEFLGIFNFRRCDVFIKRKTAEFFSGFGNFENTGVGREERIEFVERVEQADDV